MSRNGAWTFITNHGTVLSIVGQRSCITVREIASSLGITERSVHRILKDLVDEGYVSKTKDGNLNCYTVNEGLTLRQSQNRDILVGELLAALKRKV